MTEGGVEKETESAIKGEVKWLEGRKTTGWFSVNGARKGKTTCGLARHRSGGTTVGTAGLAYLSLHTSTDTHTHTSAWNVHERSEDGQMFSIERFPWSPLPSEDICSSPVYEYKRTCIFSNYSSHYHWPMKTLEYQQFTNDMITVIRTSCWTH